MKANEFASKAEEIEKLNTTYLMGGFGCRMGIDWYDKTYAWNKDNAKYLESKYNTNPITFGFDCVCLPKSIFWGFDGNPEKAYGSAIYKSNSVPDMSISTLKKSCPNLSNDFNNIEIGEILFLGNNHCGIYVGNGEVIESTAAWKCCVQRTLLPWRNTTNHDKLPVRMWDLHGKTKYLEYDYSYIALVNENKMLKNKLDLIRRVLENDG